MNAISKPFFKMHPLLQIPTDHFDITQKSILRNCTFGLCSAWRYGYLWRFGDLFKFSRKNAIVYKEAVTSQSFH